MLTGRKTIWMSNMYPHQADQVRHIRMLDRLSTTELSDKLFDYHRKLVQMRLTTVDPSNVYAAEEIRLYSELIEEITTVLNWRDEVPEGFEHFVLECSSIPPYCEDLEE